MRTHAKVRDVIIVVEARYVFQVDIARPSRLFVILGQCIVAVTV
jgi:hypothetical protein